MASRRAAWSARSASRRTASVMSWNTPSAAVTITGSASASIAATSVLRVIRLLRGGDPVRLDLAIEVTALDAEPFRRPCHVEVVDPQLGQDVRALEVVTRLAQ